MASSRFPSMHEKLMQELEANGQLSVWEPEKTQQLHNEINEVMRSFNIEKQHKAAASEKHASEIILTA